jgi:N-acetylmuramoyl-L-alanine amidase
VRYLRSIIIHCSATREGQDVSVETIRDWHTSPPRNWSDIGYHFVIGLDGTVFRGRPINKQGAHTRGQNADSIGICYIGGVDKDLNPKDTMTEIQDISLLELVKSLRLIFGELNLHGHNEYSSKACPSFDVQEKYKFLN